MTETPSEGAPKPTGPKPPPLVPGVVLLVVAAGLMAVLLINPAMSDGMRRTIAIASVAVVVALLGYAIFVFTVSRNRGRK